MSHYVRQEPVEPEPRPAQSQGRPRFRWVLAGLDFLRPGNLLRDRAASRYSSVAPRHPDGSRTKIIPFNGNGWGR
ncbi:hypothetical protein [Rhodococcus oryzae]|uniref:hypothetical protein n=1 Tax=Rhodococcus oryzae TaxID=2571143 RepID=UPI0037BA3B4D